MNKLLSFGIAIAVFTLMLASCQYKFVVEPVVPPPDSTDTIYFSQEIEPIWTEQTCTACHPGVHNPDLTPGNAYNSITSTGLVNTAEPAESKIYWNSLPDGNHYAKYTSAQAALVLQWIEQGALDN